MLARSVAHAAVFALIAGGFAAAGAQKTTRVPVAPDSRLWIEGTSNLHAWTCKATTLEAAIDIDAAAADGGIATPKTLRRVHVKVPVKSLKCGHGGMDENLYKALKADATPEISYILGTFEAVPADRKDSFALHTVGTLEVAGVEHPLEMDVAATRMPDGTLKATGVAGIRMTDYGIRPPTAIFGRLKTGNDVKVKFDLSIGASAIAAALAGGK